MMKKIARKIKKSLSFTKKGEGLKVASEKVLRAATHKVSEDFGRALVRLSER